MWKNVKAYMESSRRMEAFLEDNTTPEKIAFVTLVILYSIKELIILSFFIATLPIWIVFYLVYYDRRYK